MIDHSKGTTYTISESTSTSTSGSAHFVLSLKDPVLKKVEKLLQKTTLSIGSLKEEYQTEVSTQVKKWETSFFESYKIERNDDVGLKKAAHSLLFLNLYLENVMGNYAEKSDFEQVKWIVISNKIKKNVASILPKNVDLDTFIETDRRKLLEMQLRYKISVEIEEMMEIINALFDEFEDKIYEDADMLLDEMEICFKSLKANLIELNEYQQIEVENLHATLDTITKTVSVIYQDLKMRIGEIENLDGEVRAVDALLLSLRDELESLINKI